tara:strand:- start:1387 stop:1626 length:240 start_codon:yes stop_codon:yes gene_type:complete
MKVTFRVITLALVSLAWQGGVIAQENLNSEDNEQDRIGLAQDNQVKVTKSDKRESDNQPVFKPSEEVSEDYAVPFPADI